MIDDGAPSSWTPLMRFVAGKIADDARDPGQDKDPLPPPGEWPRPWSKIPIEGVYRLRSGWTDGLVQKCGMSARAISRTLADLAEAGYDMRSPILDRDGNPVRDKRGRLVYAANKHALEFVVPFYLPPRGEPQSSPEVATIDEQPDDDVADPESSPDLASFEPQSSPLLVPKLAESGEPISSASPEVKTGPQADASRLAEDQEPSQSQNLAGGGADGKPHPAITGTDTQANSVAKSQNRRLPNGPNEQTPDAPEIPSHAPDSATSGSSAREGRRLEVVPDAEPVWFLAACPYCGAEIGKTCINKGNLNKPTRTHDARIKAAA